MTPSPRSFPCQCKIIIKFALVQNTKLIECKFDTYCIVLTYRLAAAGYFLFIFVTSNRRLVQREQLQPRELNVESKVFCEIFGKNYSFKLFLLRLENFELFYISFIYSCQTQLNQSF